MRTHMVQLEKSRLPTTLASAINIGAPRAIAPPHLAPHGRSNRLALALARIGWLTISLRLALALALFGWHTISLRLALALAPAPERFAGHAGAWRLALAPARFARGGSRPLHLGAAVLLQLRDKQAHGLKMQLF